MDAASCKQYISELTARSRAAAAVLATSTTAMRNSALLSAAQALRNSAALLQSENTKDLETARQMQLTDAMIDRLTLSDKRIESMAVALEQIAAQSDPVGETIEGYVRPNGLRVEKRRVPLGVVGIIFESRPNVTADAGALCLKSGNACILRGGKEAINSNLAIAKILRDAIAESGLPADSIIVIDTTERAVVPAMAQAEGGIDVIIPRGGHGLIRAVVEAATIPVIKHYDGICHVYLHDDADAAMAKDIVINAKCQRPGVCNAAESLLVSKAVAESGLLAEVCTALAGSGVEIRGCEQTRAIYTNCKPATEEDWSTEYLDLIISVKVVENIEAAIAHINRYGSGHTDAIITRSLAPAQQFTGSVDSSSVMVNASTRFSDGGEYGLGAEIGISTDKLHARGPMGATDLTTYKWIVTGNGHIR